MRPLKFGSTLTVRLSGDTRELIEAAAERENATASDWIRRAIASVVRPAGSSPLPPPGARSLLEGRPA